MLSWRFSSYLWILGAVLILISDRFFKFLAAQGHFHHPKHLIGDVFSLYTVKNVHIAFSIPFPSTILNTTITLIVLILIGWLLWNIKNRRENISTMLVFLILGASSNLFDRYEAGGVIDYLHLQYFTVFNLADVMIIIGALGILWSFYRTNKTKDVPH